MSNDIAELDGPSEECDVDFHPFCYVCHFPAVQDGFFQLFAEPSEDAFSPAKMLCSILEIEVSPELCHSQIICINCNMLCIEYHSLIQRMESIRLEMTLAYNQTVMKLTGLTEKDLQEDCPVSVADSAQLDTELHSFNKELISMEEVFRMEGLVSDSIGEDPSVGPIENNFPKLGIVWQAAADTDSPQQNSLIRQDELIDKNQCHPTLSEGTTQSTLQTLEPVGIVGNRVTERTGQETLERFMSESNDGIVEVTGEDGTSIYCIYDNVIESYSDPEEQSEVSIANGADSALGYDEVIIESSSQLTAKEPAGIPETNSTSSLLPDNAGGTSLITPSTSRDAVNNSIQPNFIKLDNIYYCTLCSTDGQMKFYTLKNMAQHLNKEHDQKLHVCDQCDTVYSQRAAYKTHMEQHKEKSNDPPDVICDVCEIKFANVRLLRHHRKSHTNVPGREWTCTICDKKYTSKTFYEIHMNKHSGLRPYKCTVCAKDFTSKYVLTVHMKTHNERLRMFACDECDGSFYNRNNLIQHQRTHRGVRDFECSDCGKAFLSQHNLNVHKVIHSAQKPFVCRTCGKAFARKCEVSDHERTHTGEKPFACDICDASFAQRSNLYSHRRLTHLNDKRFKCDVCGACFKRRRLLLYHTQAAHTGERPYKCELCAATFVYPEHFHKHKRIHTGMKPYACEVCHKTFNSPDNRNAHRYVHSDKKPFECVTCGTGFMRKSHLYVHMQKRGHLNDTIVVNQPRIQNDTLEFETEPVPADNDGLGELSHEVDAGEDEENMQTIYNEEHVDGAIAADQYYIQNGDQQQEVETLLDETASGNSNMELITKIEIQDTDWDKFIVQE